MKILFSVILFLLFTGCVVSNQYENYHPSKAEQLVNTILSEVASKIKMKYNLNPCGSGVAMPGGPIQELTLCFNSRNQLTREDLRRLLIKSANELLNQLENNIDIQEFLEKKPFNINGVQIIIYNHDKNGWEIYDPGISTAEISNGILVYQTVDSTDTFNYKNEFSETYKEALKVLGIE